MSTPTLYCAMPAESLGSSPDFRLTAAFLPPRRVVARLLEAFVGWSAHHRNGAGRIGFLTRSVCQPSS